MSDVPDYDEEMRPTQFTRLAAEEHMVEQGKIDPIQGTFETLVNLEIGRSRKDQHLNDPLPPDREWCDPRYDNEVNT
jgi:hypothetical protein